MTKCNGMAALELGCGSGGNLRALADWGFAFIGIDGSTDAIALAKDVMAEHFSMGVAREMIGIHHRVLPEIGISPEIGFDLVIDILTLQHLSVKDRRLVYDEVFRLLKPGGRFFTQQWAYGDHKDIFPQHPELAFYDWLSIETDLEKSDFLIESSDVVKHSYQRRSKWATYSLVSARKPKE